MDTFNLNTDSYSEVEIEELFNLNSTYTIQDIAAAKTVLIKQLNTQNDLGAEKQREILFFIDTIANRISNKVNYNTLTAPHENIINAQGTNFLIEKPDRLAGRKADFTLGRVTVDSSPAPPGYINPINVRTITQAISFDTRFRPNYYTSKSTNFNIILPAIQKNVVSMRVATIELPLTYYAVSLSQGNATCLIINLQTQHCWVLTLPDGNYEQSWSDHSKAAFIEPALNTAILTALPATIDVNGAVTVGGAGAPAPLGATDLVYSLDRISGRSIFSAPLGSSLQNSGFTLRFNVDNAGSLNMETSIQLRLGWQLGFRAAEYVCTLSAKYTCVSEGICLISGPRYGFLAIDDHQKNTGPAYMVAFGNSILQNNIITRINLAALQAEVGIYQSSSDAGLTTQVNRTREYFGPVDIQRLHVTLYDEYGRIIDLNNMDWSFSLAFEILYN